MKKLTLSSINAEVEKLRTQISKLEEKRCGRTPRLSRLSRLSAKIPRLKIIWPAHREDDR